MDKKLKLLKETWKQLNEFMRVHEYSSGSDMGSGFYTFFISDVEYVASVDEFRWKDFEGLDVSFGVVRREDDTPWVDYQVTLNSVDATDVIATVAQIVIDVANVDMQGKDKWLLSFNPTKDQETQEGTETKRSKLYKRITERISSKHGWNMAEEIKMDKDSVAFLMTRIK